MYSFEERARKVHGDKYDYSRVKYVNLLTKVEIVCSKHGPFWQEPKSHLAGHGCPHKDCVREKLEATNMDRYGVARPLQSKEIHGRVIETNMRVYGVRNPSMTQAVSDKRIATCREKYGVDYSLQAPEVIEKRKITNNALYGGNSPFCSSSVRKKAGDTLEERYGVRNSFLLSETWDKVRATNRLRYGVDYPLLSPDIQAKRKVTMLRRYGVEFSYQSPDLLSKALASKRMHGTMSSSSSEDKLYGFLISMFGIKDVERNYHLDSRYPFACDFYIKSRDLFIELNAHWTHGGYWFDATVDMDKLALLSGKAINSTYYVTAVHVWTNADVRKRKMAQLNNLNYVVFWDNKLRDFEMWRDAGCPSSRDWECEYQWFYEREGIK